MEKYMEIEEFQKDIEAGNLEKVYEEIVKRALKLVEKIAETRKIPLIKQDNLEQRDIFYMIKYSFERYTIFFQSVQTLMEAFLRWDMEPEDDWGETKEQRLVRYANIYNTMVNGLKMYQETEEKIQKKGYEALKQENIEKLIALFKEMMDYKNKPYNEKWSFREWIDNIDTHYHFYHETLLDVLEEIQSGYFFTDTELYSYDSIEVNEVERIIELEYLYRELADKEDGYKQYANFYREIELKEGQTYSDLYDLEKEKFVSLFKEMLDFAGAKYDTDYFDALQSEIITYYPYYSDMLTHLSARMWSTEQTYITLLDAMETIYENLSKNYKNRENDLEKYKEKLKKQEMDDDNEWLF